jgi:hypothetical protein
MKTLAKRILIVAVLSGGLSGLLPRACGVGGVPLWTNLYDGAASGDDYAYAIAVDTSGKVFVTGTSDGGDSNHLDYATVAYSSTGLSTQGSLSRRRLAPLHGPGLADSNGAKCHSGQRRMSLAF